MPGLTPVRVRLSVEQKVKIIEESKKKGFCRKDICKKYGISAATLSQISKIRTHLMALGEDQETFESLQSVERIFIKKSLEQSNSKQTKLTNYFNVNQLTLK